MIIFANKKTDKISTTNNIKKDLLWHK
jgi:hypothetical protein